LVQLIYSRIILWMEDLTEEARFCAGCSSQETFYSLMDNGQMPSQVTNRKHPEINNPQQIMQNKQMPRNSVKVLKNDQNHQQTGITSHCR